MTKRIAFINSVYASGSTGRIVERLYNYSKANDFECKVIYSRNNIITSEDIFKVYSKTGFYNHVCKALLFDKHGLYSNKNTDEIISILEDFQPDIINIHNLHGFYVNYDKLMSYIKSKRIYVVLTLHDCWNFTGFCSHFDANGCNEWQNGCIHCKYKKVYPYRIGFSNSKRNYICKSKAFHYDLLTIVTPSLWLKQLVGMSLLKDHLVVQIPNNVDDTIFNRNPLITRDENIILAVSSIWTNQKGLSDIIKLSSMLDDNKKLIVVGKGSRKIKNALSFEKLSQKELAKLYQKACCFINLTYEDTFPTVNLEALSCGCPVITYRTGGSSELCNSSSNIVDKGDVIKIANLINRESYDSYVPEFVMPNMCDEYNKLFRKVLGE